MKSILSILLLLALTLTASAQTMRDSTASIPITARACVIAVSYQGAVVRDTLTPEQVAAWITHRGVSSPDTTAPIQRGIISHLRTEIGRCHQMSLDQMAVDMAGVDQDDTQTLAQIRAARAAIRAKYRQWIWSYPVKVPIWGAQP